MMRRHLTAIALLTLIGAPLAAQAPSPAKQAALAAAASLDAEVRRISMELWDYAEIALREDRSAELLAATLEAEGFTVTRGVAGMPTAFIAEYGSGSPIIGILAEFDALPGVGNQPVPRREPRADAVASGHGCGHNLFGAASVMGAVAVKRAMAAQGVAGTIRLYGTPAEETVVGKVYMAKAGLFDDLDGCIEWHPGTENQVRNQPGRALNNFEVEFFGQAAHASADPWNGRSALDAVEMLNFGVNMMREHVLPTARIHYVIPNGGEAPNVVPEYAKVWYYVRDVNRELVQSNYDRILNIAAGAAMATETTHKVFLTTGVHRTLLNRPLQERVQANLTAIGAPQFTGDEQAFARELQEFCEKPTVGFKTEIKPLAPEPEPVSGGSTDVAEVSWITPTVGFNVVTAAYGVPWHSWATTACHGTEAGVKGALIATRVIAATGIDMLTDATLMASARALFEAETAGKPYVSPIPLDQQVPLPDKK